MARQSSLGVPSYATWLAGSETKPENKQFCPNRKMLQDILVESIIVEFDFEARPGPELRSAGVCRPTPLLRKEFVFVFVFVFVVFAGQLFSFEKKL